MVREALYQAPIMRKCWETGSFWYFHAINSPKGMCRVFTEHIKRLFYPQHCEMRIFEGRGKVQGPIKGNIWY